MKLEWISGRINVVLSFTPLVRNIKNIYVIMGEDIFNIYWKDDMKTEES